MLLRFAWHPLSLSVSSYYIPLVIYLSLSFLLFFLSLASETFKNNEKRILKNA